MAIVSFIGGNLHKEITDLVQQGKFVEAASATGAQPALTGLNVEILKGLLGADAEDTKRHSAAVCKLIPLMKPESVNAIVRDSESMRVRLIGSILLAEANQDARDAVLAMLPSRLNEGVFLALGSIVAADLPALGGLPLATSVARCVSKNPNISMDDRRAALSCCLKSDEIRDSQLLVLLANMPVLAKVKVLQEFPVTSHKNDLSNWYRSALKDVCPAEQAGLIMATGEADHQAIMASSKSVSPQAFRRGMSLAAINAFAKKSNLPVDEAKQLLGELTQAEVMQRCIPEYLVIFAKGNSCVRYDAAKVLLSKGYTSLAAQALNNPGTSPTPTIDATPEAQSLRLELFKAEFSGTAATWFPNEDMLKYVKDRAESSDFSKQLQAIKLAFHERIPQDQKEMYAEAFNEAWTGNKNRFVDRLDIIAAVTGVDVKTAIAK
jgi:hypothetical protein